MADYLLPDVGEGLTEAEIVSWRVKEGDVVEINDIVVEIETAKSLVELPSPYAGTVTALLVPEGETVPVGTPIISIGDASSPVVQERGTSVSTPAAPAAGASVTYVGEIDLSNPAASGGGEGESLVGRNKADRGPQRRPRKGPASPSTEAGAATQLQLQGAFTPGGAQTDDVAAADEPPVPATSAVEPEEPVADMVPPGARHETDVRVLAKPPVRKLAKDRGIDLGSVTPTGANGTITRDDVLSVVEEGRRTRLETTEAGLETRAGARSSTGVRGDDERERREPIKGVRKMMGQAMVDSAFTAPHVTEWVTVDVTRTMEFIERLKTRSEFRDVKVSPLLVLARAAILAMRRAPEINSWWDEEAQEIVFKGYVNLGIAAATPRGLVVPHIKDADQLSLLQLAEALNRLAATAREGRTQPAEMAGGTFTITNVGVFGVDAGTPIINPGESAILCFGAVRKQPWVVSTEQGDEIVVRQVTQLALSFDHRHVDGEKGSRFLSDVASIMEDPATGLAF
ncbi:MAG: catalytic protein of component of various dehydrogenase complexe [Marmoricola sp.]|nr:catalytic protein of component of various dehydrogenase complexe [Marmoricola sp.]